MKKISLLLKKCNNDILKNIIVFVVGCAGVWGVLKTLNIGADGIILSNSLIPILLLLVIICLYKKFVSRHNKRETFFEVVFATFVSMILVLGRELDAWSDILWTAETILEIVCVAVYIFPLINISLSFIDRAKLRSIQIRNRKKFFIITFCIVFAGGLLVWLATYPGIWGYDAATQFATITNVDESLTRSVGAHYSLPLGGLMTGIMVVGKNIFGSYQGGLALCCFLQMLFLSYVATRIITYATLRTNSVYLYVAALVFFTFFPFYTATTIYMTQDAVFGGLFALAFINLSEMATNVDYWKKKRNPVILALLLLLICLSRNNGFYSLIVAFMFAVIFMKKRRLAVVAIFVIPMGLYQIYNGPILSAMGVSTSSAISEMLSIPSQQLARVYNYNREVFGGQDKERLDLYYSGHKDFAEYTQYPSIADFTKRYINRTETSSDLLGYMKLWLKIGVKDPKNYIEAFLLNNIGFWYPFKNYPDVRMGIPYYEYDMTDRGDERFLVIDRDSKIAWYDSLLENILVEDAFVEIPIFSTLCSLGTYFILFCFVVGVSIVKKKWVNLVPLGLVAGFILTLLLSPVAVFRYGFPVVILWPIFIFLIFNKSIRVVKKNKSVVE